MYDNEWILDILDDDLFLVEVVVHSGSKNEDSSPDVFPNEIVPRF